MTPPMIPTGSSLLASSFPDVSPSPGGWAMGSLEGQAPVEEDLELPTSFPGIATSASSTLSGRPPAGRNTRVRESDVIGTPMRVISLEWAEYTRYFWWD